MKEGEICFANETLMQIEAPLVQGQLIETAILNMVNYQTLIATKASRIKQVVGDDIVMEFGTRRAHEMDAAIWGTRAAYIGGFDGHFECAGWQAIWHPCSRNACTCDGPGVPGRLYWRFTNMPAHTATAYFWSIRTMY